MSRDQRDYTKAEILDIIEKEAKAHGIPPEDFLRFAYIETGGRFDETASRGPNGAKGLFQFVPSTARQYGIEGRELDPMANTEAAARLYMENRRSIVRSHEMTDRSYLSANEAPNGLDMYLAHQQGAGGYRSIQNAIDEGHFSRRDTRAHLLNNVSAKDFEAVTGKDYQDFVRMADQDMARAFVDYWGIKFDRIRIPEKGIKPIIEARVVRDQPVQFDHGGITLQAAYDLTMQHDEVRYGFGSKTLNTGKIDCSGWAVEMINATYAEINEKAGRKVFGKSDHYNLGMDAASSIVHKAEQQSGRLIEGRNVTREILREGMIIGEDNGAKGWDKDRYKGIDHIVFVLRDPRSGEMMVSQSRGGEGVELLPLEDYLAYKHKRGTKLFASDPLAEARSLLLSEKDYTLQTPGVGTKSDHRDGHEQETNLSEQAQAQAADAPVGLKRRPLLSEPGHPDYLLYVQSYDRLKQLSTELGFKDESAYVNAAASIAVEAKAQNLKRVDHVLLSTHGLSLFAVQGKIDDPGNQWIQIDKAAAVSHAVQLSTIEVDVLRQKRQEELSLDTEFRTAMTR
jgi:hypothetical protein